MRGHRYSQGLGPQRVHPLVIVASAGYGGILWIQWEPERDGWVMIDSTGIQRGRVLPPPDFGCW
jgi:hypothetical protein